MANKPKIRFKGFDDAWEQRKLLSCIQSITDFRGRTPKKLGMDWSESGYLALSALNVKDGYIDFSQDVHYGNQELYDKWMSGKELHRGQVLFTTEAPMGNVAQVPDNKGYILSQRTIAFDVEEKILSENFLATLLRTPNVFNDLIALSSGGTAKGVSQKSLSGLDVVIPKNIDEQNKLADYFINLDNLITLHQRKCDQMKELKKYMLKKMFPQNGAKVPEIRFDGFTDDWEQRKVSEIAIEKLSNGIMNNQSDGETGVKHINVINMYDTDKIHPEKLAFSNYEEDAVKKCNVEFGDIFLTRSSLKPEGIAEANVLLNSGRFVYDDHLIRVKVNKEKYDPFFVKLNLSGNAFKRQFIVRAKTTAFTTIGQEDISECLGSFPKKEEQQQIGECFMVIDHLITLHQHKCNELREIKKYMLKNMFI